MIDQLVAVALGSALSWIGVYVAGRNQRLLSAEERADATVRDRTARHAAAARDRLEYRRDLYGKLLGAIILLAELGAKPAQTARDMTDLTDRVSELQAVADIVAGGDTRKAIGEAHMIALMLIGTSKSNEERTKAVATWRQKRGALQGTMRMELDLLETAAGGGAMIGSPAEGSMAKPNQRTH